MGQVPHRVSIASISLSPMCVVTTDGEHGFSTLDFVRLSNMNGMMPAPQNGMPQLNNKRFRIILTGLDSFYIQDPITFEWIDSTGFTPYVAGGSCNLITHNYVYQDDGDNNG